VVVKFFSQLYISLIKAIRGGVYPFRRDG